ncbi:MAG TPA: hypothetical protein VM577_03625 [Anaerovoracaceae bacterium]|nr:hypothetical protein [Anaerovoracaceae bacterium]
MKHHFFWSINTGLSATFKTCKSLREVVEDILPEILGHVDYDVQEAYGEMLVQYNLTQKTPAEFRQNQETYDEEDACQPASPDTVMYFLNGLARKFNKRCTINIQKIKE